MYDQFLTPTVHEDKKRFLFPNDYSATVHSINGQFLVSVHHNGRSFSPITFEERKQGEDNKLLLDTPEEVDQFLTTVHGLDLKQSSFNSAGSLINREEEKDNNREYL